MRAIDDKIMALKRAANNPASREKTMHAWKDMENAGKEISKKWKGADAVKEIKSQRRK